MTGGATGSTSGDPTASTSTTGEPPDPSTGSCGFVCDSTTGEQTACNAFEQDCPAGQKCNFAGDGGPGWHQEICVPVTGDGVLGDPCTVVGAINSGHDDCAAGFMCFEVVGETGTCAAICAGEWRGGFTCPDGTAMGITNDICICVPNCDPLDQAACPEGLVCAPNFDNVGFSCSGNVPPGEQPPGSSCELGLTCDAGSWCSGDQVFPHPGCTDPELGCCTPFCDLSQGTADNPLCKPFAGDVPGVECVSFYAPGEPPPGLESIGVCAVP